MGKPWGELKKELERVVFKRGVKEVADAIPADRATVYRLIGTTKRPSRAVRAGVERVVENEGK